MRDTLPSLQALPHKLPHHTLTAGPVRHAYSPLTIHGGGGASGSTHAQGLLGPGCCVQWLQWRIVAAPCNPQFCCSMWQLCRVILCKDPAQSFSYPTSPAKEWFFTEAIHSSSELLHSMFWQVLMFYLCNYIQKVVWEFKKKQPNKNVLKTWEIGWPNSLVFIYDSTYLPQILLTYKLLT